MKKKQYDLVQNDEFDCRVPLHTDEAFHHGILFQAKLIGTLEIPRPTSRVEIVAAMRRIRYEFKAKGIDKKKVTIFINEQGVKVISRKRKVKKESFLDDNRLVIQHHPIYRIFYVSHDSQDLKIFSYIARESHSNSFKCSVFKANKKNLAIRVVRTIGQAFEVCHDVEAEENVHNSVEDSEDLSQTHRIADSSSDPLSMDLPPYDSVDLINTNLQKLESLCLSSDDKYSLPMDLSLTLADMNEANEELDFKFPQSAHHELQLLRERLAQQQHQAQAALAQVHHLRNQLQAETAARLEAQSRTRQLLTHNAQLLVHLRQLVTQLRRQESSGSWQTSRAGSSSRGDQQLPTRPSAALAEPPASPLTQLSWARSGLGS